jgi:hypothetical protein
LSAFGHLNGPRTVQAIQNVCQSTVCLLSNGPGKVAYYTGPPGTTKRIRNFYFWNLDACATLIGRRVMRACPACRRKKIFEGAVFARLLIGGIATVANRLSEVLKTPRKN